MPSVAFMALLTAKSDLSKLFLINLVPGNKADQACCAAVYTVFNTVGHINQRQSQKLLSRLSLYRLSVHDAILLTPEGFGPIHLGGFTWCPHDVAAYNAIG